MNLRRLASAIFSFACFVHKMKNEKKIKEIDKALTDFAKKMGLTIYLMPVNLAEEKKKFFKRFNKKEKYNPQFYYQKPKTDFKKIEKELKEIVIWDKSEIGVFLKKIRKSLILKSETAGSIGEKNFTEKSCRLYGKPSPKILSIVKKQLKNYNTFRREKKEITSKKALLVFKKEIKKNGLNWEIQEKEIVSKVKTGNGKKYLYIKKGESFGNLELKNLVVHEIETHIFRKENGVLQPLKILAQTCPCAETDEEGLAIYNETRSGLNEERFKTILLRVLAVSLAQKYSFFDVFKKLLKFNIPSEQAFNICVRVKRGLSNTSTPGGFTKDYIYFKGYLEVKKFADKRGDIKKLYIGKVSISDFPVILKIKGIKPPKYLAYGN